MFKTVYTTYRKFAIAFVVLVLCLCFSGQALSQNTARNEITGLIQSPTGEPIGDINIFISGTGIGTISNTDGTFLLNYPGKYPIEIVFSSIGWETKTITLKAMPDSPVLITLNPSHKLLEGVQVVGSRTVSPHSQKIDPQFVRQLPSAAGPGIESLVRSQMGVTSNNELSSQYRVRGGNFDENLVYVNGQEVYRPFLIHSGQQEGLSFVNPDMVESVEFSAGGFSASYGDKMSSVLDITYKQPKYFGGSFSGGLLGGSTHLEGVALKQKLTWITGVRYKTNRYLLGSLEEKGDYNPSFTDIQTYLTYKPSPRLTFEFLGNYSNNRYQFIPSDRETTFGTISEVKRLKIYFAGGEVDQFQTGFGSFATTFLATEKDSYKFSVSGFRTFEEETYDIAGAYWLQELESLDGSDDSNVTNIGIGEYLQHARNDLFAVVTTARLEGTHKTGRGDLKWGITAQREFFKDHIQEWEMIDSAGYSIPYNGSKLELAYFKFARNKISNNRISAYIKKLSSYGLGNGNILIDAGLRAGYFSFNDEFILGPRLQFTYLPDHHQNYRIRLSGGYYYQPPFFKEYRKPDGSLNDQLKSQKSIHLVGGFDYYFSRRQQPFKFTTEAYYKILQNIIPYQVDNVRVVYSGMNEAKGYVAGIDFKINGELVPGEESWATLSLMKTEEDLKNDTYLNTNQVGTPGYIPRPSDQRLNFSLFLQDHLPNAPNFKAHLSFVFGTGLPFGPPRSPRYMAINRMPPYRRVDLGFSYDLMKNQRFALKTNRYLKNLWLGIEVLNLPNIDNTISYYWVSDVNNRQYAVPNYLTSRRINFRITGKF